MRLSRALSSNIGDNGTLLTTPAVNEAYGYRRASVNVEIPQVGTPAANSDPLRALVVEADIRRRMELASQNRMRAPCPHCNCRRRASEIVLPLRKAVLPSQMGEHVDEMMGNDIRELRSHVDNWLRNVETRRREHGERLKSALQNLVQDAESHAGTTILEPPPPVDHVQVISPNGEVLHDLSRCLPGTPDERPAVTADPPEPDSAATRKPVTDQAKSDPPKPANTGKTVANSEDVKLAAQEVKPVESETSDSTKEKVTVRRSTWRNPDPAHWLPQPHDVKAVSWRNYVKKTDAGLNIFQSRRDSWRSSTQDVPGSLLLRVATSPQYEFVSGLLIILNAIFIGYQTQWTSVAAFDLFQAGDIPPAVRQPVIFFIFEIFFFVLFSFELGFRWVADGFVAFFSSADRNWNLFDIVVVFLSFVDLVLSIVERASQLAPDLSLGGVNASILRVMRIVRVIRVARIIRVMRFFRELRMMIYSILGSAKSLLWSVTVLLLLFYIFGISLTTGTLYYLQDTQENIQSRWAEPATESLRRSFGTLNKSILSLYMAMSGGRSWGEFYWDLSVLHPIYPGLFMTFVTVAIFAVGNVVTGIFVENALQKNLTDTDLLIQENLESRRKYFKQLQEVFSELDSKDTGYVTLEEFEDKLEDEKVVALFKVQDLEVSDAKMLFTLLDYDQSGSVAIDEFMAGCDKLKGGSRSLDLAIMELELRWLKEAFLGFADFMESNLGIDQTEQSKHPSPIAEGVPWSTSCLWSWQDVEPGPAALA